MQINPADSASYAPNPQYNPNAAEHAEQFAKDFTAASRNAQIQAAEEARKQAFKLDKEDIEDGKGMGESEEEFLKKEMQFLKMKMRNIISQQQPDDAPTRPEDT